MKTRAAKQLDLPIRRWGGKRKGAGRRPNGEKSGVSHLRRPVLARRFPVHVTVRMRCEVWNLRSGRCFRVLKRAFAAAREKFGMRLCHFSVMGNHVHMLVEATEAQSLSRGMQGLGIRMAKALNREMKKQGAVYADRYHAHILKTPSEVARALNYVMDNARKHGLIRRGIDPFSSWNPTVDCTMTPLTWLLRPKDAAAAAAGTRPHPK
jgi:REP-associated tyrosine transposase